MDFASYSSTLRSRLHLGGYRLPVLIGCTVAAILLIIAVGATAAKALTEPTISIDKSANEQAQSEAVEDATPKTLFVHVGGAVAAPGLYELTEGSRLQAAIDAAGGFAEGANTDALNLARTVADGEQIIVPVLAASESADSSSSSNVAAAAGSGATASDKVNINTATSEQLQTLKGVGPSMAQKIIDDRTANGPYKTIEDVKRVSGIGDKKYAAISASICVG